MPVTAGRRLLYCYADISDLGMDSAAFSQRLLLEAGVAAVPGLDFGPAHGDYTMRFSYATAWTAWKRPSIAWASCWVTEPAFGFHEKQRALGARFPVAGARPDRDQSLASAMPDASARRRRSACTLAP